MKNLSSIISLLVIVLLVFGIISFRNSDFYQTTKENVFRLTQNVMQRVKIYWHNISFDFFPQRVRPVSFIEREQKLRVFLPQVFGEFQEQDWQDFWDVIYEPILEEQNNVKIKRYRTQEEIESYFLMSYPRAFSRFKNYHWDYFWSTVF